MSGITVKGSLTLGIEFNSEIHKDFEMRPSQVKDSIAAEGVAGNSQIKMLCALLAGQLLRLGTIPKEAITVDLLIDLYDADLGVLQQAREDVEKKLLQPSGS